GAPRTCGGPTVSCRPSPQMTRPLDLGRSGWQTVADRPRTVGILEEVIAVQWTWLSRLRPTSGGDPVLLLPQKRSVTVVTGVVARRAAWPEPESTSRSNKRCCRHNSGNQSPSSHVAPPPPLIHGATCGTDPKPFRRFVTSVPVGSGGVVPARRTALSQPSELGTDGAGLLPERP